MNLRGCVDLIKAEFDVDYGVIENFYTLYGDRAKVLNFDDKGFFIYVVAPNLTNQLEMTEMFLYLFPDHRNARNMSKFLKCIEKLAISESCDILKIGSNSGYNDRTFIEYLKRKGYIADTMKKEFK